MRRFATAAMVACGLAQAHDPISTRLTWSQEISRIVHKRCVTCHRPGGSAPMPLTTYEESRPWAKAIAEEVLQRRMPPWGAVKGFGEFRDDPSLTQEEISRLAEWVEGGSPEGDPAYLPLLSKSQVKRSTPPPGHWVRKPASRSKILAIRPLASVPSAQIVVESADGSILPLLWLQNYGRKWNRTFVFREPVVLGTDARVVASPAVALEFLIQPVPQRRTALR